MSATFDDVKPFIKDAISQVYDDRYVLRPDWRPNDYDDRELWNSMLDKSKEIISYSIKDPDGSQRFNLIAIPDEETLCDWISRSEKKSVLFIDNKEFAESLKQILVENRSVSEKDIVILNADNLENVINRPVVEALTIKHKVLPKILITTSVLDNGVSIHDEDVENLLIITDSKISFLQMVGRLRSESTDRCNLLFLIRPASVFSKRMNLLEESMTVLKEIKESGRKDSFSVVDSIFENNDEDEELLKMYYKFLAPIKSEYEEFLIPVKKLPRTQDAMQLVANKIAIQKTEDAFINESDFYKLAVLDPIKVIYEQMDWIDRSPDELTIYSSSYMEEMKEKLVVKLLEVKEFSRDQLKEFKGDIAKEFINYLERAFPEKKWRSDRSFENSKLEEICNRLSLQIIEGKDSDRNNNKTYTIMRKEGDEDGRNEADE